MRTSLGVFRRQDTRYFDKTFPVNTGRTLRGPFFMPLAANPGGGVVVAGLSGREVFMKKDQCDRGPVVFRVIDADTSAQLFCGMLYRTEAI